MKKITGFANSCHRIWMTLFILIFLTFPACLFTSDSQDIPADQQYRFETMKKQGSDATMTILPVGFGHMTNDRIGMVVGIFLEKAGMKNLEFENINFTPDQIDFELLLKDFSQFVREHAFKTDYVLFGQFLIEGRSIAQVRGVVMDKGGELVWQDCVTSADPVFQNAQYQPKDPMSGCIFLAQRISAALELGDPLREDAPEGKIARMMNESSGLPPKEEFAEMEKRQAALKESHSNAHLLVYPALMEENSVDGDCANNLASLLNASHLCQATASNEQNVIKFDKNLQGQNTLLWSVARSFQQLIREKKPDADYALYAHYGFNAESDPKAFFINFIVCDRNGDWVITDLANSHHEDFQAMNWQSPADCDRFVAQRLEGYLK